MWYCNRTRMPSGAGSASSATGAVAVSALDATGTRAEAARAGRLAARQQSVITTSKTTIATAHLQRALTSGEDELSLRAATARLTKNCIENLHDAVLRLWRVG